MRQMTQRQASIQIDHNTQRQYFGLHTSSPFSLPHLTLHPFAFRSIIPFCTLIRSANPLSFKLRVVCADIPWHTSSNIHVFDLCASNIQVKSYKPSVKCNMIALVVRWVKAKLTMMQKLPVLFLSFYRLEFGHQAIWVARG